MKTFALPVAAALMLSTTPLAWAQSSTTHTQQNRQQMASRDTTTEDTSRARMKTEDRGQRREVDQELRDAANTYRTIVSEAPQDKRIPSEVLKNARCVAVFPSVGSAALVVGGRHGSGVAACRKGGDWNEVALVDLTGGSLGVQAGAEKSQVVAFFMDENAQQALENGPIRLGADLSATAGNYGAELTTENRGKHVLAYSQSQGAYAGLSLTGTSISPDEDAYKAVLGPNISDEAMKRPIDASKVPAARELISQIKASMV